MSNENELPPDDASPAQLLMLIQALRREVAFVRQQNTDLLTKQKLTDEKVDTLTKSFDNAKFVATVVKWLAAVGAGAVAIYGAFRSLV